jgi:tetratricopeptide (TPR) repeat protein
MATRAPLEIAQQHEKKGNLAKAAEAYSQHLARNPEDARTLLRYGEIQERLGQPEPAADAFHRLAVLHIKGHIETKATAALRRALKLAPDHFASAELLADLHSKGGKKRDAFEVLTAAIRATVASGDQATRLKLLQRVAQVDDGAGSKLELAQALVDKGRRTEAIDLLRETAQQLQAPIKAYDRMEVLERWQQISPADRGVAFDGAATALSLGNPRRALASLRVALDSIPDDVDVIAMVGTVLDAMGEDTHALPVHREAARKFTLARRTEEGRKSWIAVLRLSPADPEALQAIGAERVPTAPPPPSKGEPVLDLDPSEIEGALSFLAEHSPPATKPSIEDHAFEISLDDLDKNLTIERDLPPH